MTLKARINIYASGLFPNSWIPSGYTVFAKLTWWAISGLERAGSLLNFFIIVLCRSQFNNSKFFPFYKKGKKYLHQLMKEKNRYIQKSFIRTCLCAYAHSSLFKWILYNNPSYSRILIGSRLWSIRGQMHTWRQRSIQFFLIFLILNLNQSQFFAKYSNQSVRFILYRHKITSVLFSCLSKWRNLK